MNTDAAADWGELLEIRDAWCPQHGRVHPDLLAFPFTMTAEALRRFPPQCGARACEEGIEVDAAVVLEQNPQHVYVHVDGPDGHLPGIPRLAIHVTPQPDGRIATGRGALPDRPSGVAVVREPAIEEIYRR